MPPILEKLAEHLRHRPHEPLRLTGLRWYAGDGGPARGEALALLDGKFIAKAPAEAASLDLSGLTLLPGLCDAHLHLFGEAQRRLRVDLSGMDRRELLWERLATCDEEGPLAAFGWDESEWDDPRFPTRRELEERIPGREIMLVRVCGHVAVASGPALSHLESRPKLGDLETGLLLEEEANALRRHYAIPASRLVEEAGSVALELASEGLTTVTEMGAAALGEIMPLLDDDFPLRVECYHAVTAGSSLDMQVGDSGIHRLLGRKCFLDGSIGGRSAALELDYLEGGRGELLWQDGELDAALEDAFAGGLGAALHAIGSRAVDQALAAVERVGAPEGRVRIEHLETARTDQLETMARLGVGAGFQPNFLDRWGRPGGLYEQRLGQGWRRHFPGPGALRAAGLRPAYGTDGMPRDLWAALRASVDSHLHCEDADRPEEALAAVTGDAANLAGRGDGRGRVAPGLEADFAIFADDPLADGFRARPISLMTVRAGRQTWPIEEGKA